MLRSNAPFIARSLGLSTTSSPALSIHSSQTLTNLTRSTLSRTSTSTRALSTPPGKSWQVQSSADIQRVTQVAMIHELQQAQTDTIAKTVPWYLTNMPPSYFRQTSYQTRLDHVKAIAAIKSQGHETDLSLDIKSSLPDGSRVITYIRPENRRGLLLKLIDGLPIYENKVLNRVQLYQTEDHTMCLNMFTWSSDISHTDVHELPDIAKGILTYAEGLQSGEIEGSGLVIKGEMFERQSMIDYMTNCTKGYLNNSVPRRFLTQRALFKQVSGGEGVAVSTELLVDGECNDEIDNVNSKPMYWVDMAVANSLPQYALEHSARVMKINDMNIIRTHLDNVADGENGTVTMLRMLVQPADKDFVDDVKFWKRLNRNLKRFKWIDPSTVDLVIERYPWLGVRKGEIITAFSALMHPIMGKESSIVYSKASIASQVTSERHINVSSKIADLFIKKFDPANERNMTDEEVIADGNAIRDDINATVVDSSAVKLLNKMVDIVEATLRTNLFLEDRYALGLRLKPSIMTLPADEERELPYGILFAHGRRFNGYHVRFRDIARGGMRIVTPPTAEQLSLESGRHYDEAYGLAFAQQMKNKDIPEGGSKCVCLVDSVDMGKPVKNFVVRKAIKAFADTILDLIVKEPEAASKRKDYYGKDEVLYLGPDEQVIPEDIDWIVQRAAKRGYDTPPAFMSSKPKAGINHKVYGVTSEGINVFLEVALNKILGIDPRTQPFTVKMTGGPDGDVCGNEIKILYREYGDNVKIVGLGDGTAGAEDPNGLDRGELMRLFEAALPLSEYNPALLSKDGKHYLANNEEGMRLRNTMHNRVIADAFIPAGGRPNTIDINNYKKFLREDGTPSSKLIVEGANLFTTQKARDALFHEAGVLIVKDSSANKCGVICSSYEICAAMLLTEQEFLDNKTQVVADVLDKLRYFAKVEADLLFREFANYPGDLPYFSKQISDTINSMTDALANELVSMSLEDRRKLYPLIKNHLPNKMVELAFDRLESNVPEAYIIAAIASSLASKVVYNEGVNFVKSQPLSNLSIIALKYLEVEAEVAELEVSLSECEGMEEGKKEEIKRLLRVGGVRTKLGIF